MSAQTATIRELRTDFRSVKQKIEQQGQIVGQIVITDHGEPAYLLTPVPQLPKKSIRLADYYDQLVKRQPKALSTAATRRFWEEERR